MLRRHSPAAHDSDGEAAAGRIVRLLQNALVFIQQHPEVGKDILAYAACGAIGQVFIFMTLSKFSSLVLVTVTVTRKMLSMIFSVVDTHIIYRLK